MLNSAGHILASRDVPEPIAIAQNSKLDLYVGGVMYVPNSQDTTRLDTVGVIYKIYLVRHDTVYNAGTDSLPNIRDTSYYYYHDLARAPMRVIWAERAYPRRRFPGITVLPNNQFLVARSGPDNSSFIDPDTRVLLFDRTDQLITPLGTLVTGLGSGIVFINQPTSIASFPGKRDFILTQSSAGGVYGAIWMVYYLQPDFEGWLPKFDPEQRPEDRNVDFARQGRFVEASAVAFDRRRGDIFIVDAALDSVVKFDSQGRFKRESFGDYIAAVGEFSDTTGGRNRGFAGPRGVAFFERTLYVVDTGHHVIRLFRLSLDLL